MYSNSYTRLLYDDTKDVLIALQVHFSEGAMEKDPNLTNYFSVNFFRGDYGGGWYEKS